MTRSRVLSISESMSLSTMLLSTHADAMTHAPPAAVKAPFNQFTSPVDANKKPPVMERRFPSTIPGLVSST